MMFDLPTHISVRVCMIEWLLVLPTANDLQRTMVVEGKALRQVFPCNNLLGSAKNISLLDLIKPLIKF